MKRIQKLNSSKYSWVLDGFFDKSIYVIGWVAIVLFVISLILSVIKGMFTGGTPI